MMSRKCSAIALLGASISIGSCFAAKAQTSPFSIEAKQKAEALLKQMTLDEKLGQLNESSGLVMPGLATEKPDDLIEKGGVGSILWQMDVKEINRLQHIAVENSRLHIPILFGFDVIHGYRTVFPVPLAMASSWDPSVEEQAQHLAAEDAVEQGKVPGLGRSLRRIFSRAWKSYVARRGYREGTWGIALALVSAIYPILVYLKAVTRGAGPPR